MKQDCPLELGSTVWAYFRDSGGEGQERSVSQQLEAAKEYAANHRVELSQTFADRAKPGSSTVGREALQDLLTSARQLAPSRKDRRPGSAASSRRRRAAAGATGAGPCCRGRR